MVMMRFVASATDGFVLTVEVYCRLWHLVWIIVSSKIDCSFKLSV